MLVGLFPLSHSIIIVLAIGGRIKSTLLEPLVFRGIVSVVRVRGADFVRVVREVKDWTVAWHLFLDVVLPVHGLQVMGASLPQYLIRLIALNFVIGLLSKVAFVCRVPVELITWRKFDLLVLLFWVGLDRLFQKV